jgi:hypothetical protein
MSLIVINDGCPDFFCKITDETGVTEFKASFNLDVDAH